MYGNIPEDASQRFKYGWKGIFMHEMFHTFGIGHTQRRPDRDEHIAIIEDHIEPSCREQFSKCMDCKTHGPYDCGSIMHYPSGLCGLQMSVLNETISLPTIVPLHHSCTKFGGYTPTENDWKGLRYKLECNTDTIDEANKCSCDEKNDRIEINYDEDNGDSNSEAWTF